MRKYPSPDLKNYLRGNSARSTSAAPLYFEPFLNSSAGVICRDGGLSDNNPIQIAIDEARSIWGTSAVFDAIISVGSGRGSQSPTTPMTKFLIPDWLITLFHKLLATLNGQEYWTEFYARSDDATKLRARRLNVKFVAPKEPGLDDVSRVPSMKAEAEEFEFYKPESESSFIQPPTNDLIKEVALELRASLFFFQPQAVSPSKDNKVKIVSGVICCRLNPHSDAFKTLCNKTTGFNIPGPFVDFPPIESCLPRFLLKVSFQHDIRLSDRLVQIDVKFEDGYSVPISGFPTAFAVSPSITSLRSALRMSRLSRRR